MDVTNSLAILNFKVVYLKESNRWISQLSKTQKEFLQTYLLINILISMPPENFVLHYQSGFLNPDK